MDAKITYINEQGETREVLLSKVLFNIGWEYGVSPDVLDLSPDNNPKIIKIEVIQK
jgi:hypothetical protein